MANLLPDSPIASMDSYLAQGGGTALETALAMSPDEVVEEVTEARLRGRGGAGFPTGTKWASIAAAAAGSTAYLACNAAEGEPGTAKDRALMAADPYQLVEGICIGLHAIGAAAAVVGVKARYTREVARLDEAVTAAVAAGWEGADRITVVTGPDEYLFGEESALLEVVERKLPMPRILPPYMQGLYATMAAPNPTAVNNVETLCHVTHILRDGAAAWREVGTETTPGTMVFTVSGDCERPGIYELPMGTSLRTLVCDLAGAEDPAFLISGVSNAVITPDLLDLPMDFDSFAEAGTGLGSGGFVVYGPHRDVVQVTAQLAEFLAIESCGQCNACALGTAAMADALDRIDRGVGGPEDLDEIAERVVTVTSGNRCYLPVGAQLTVGSMLEEYGAAFRARLGVPGDADVAVPVPKIDRVEDGEIAYDRSYAAKRRDWSYDEEVLHALAHAAGEGGAPPDHPARTGPAGAKVADASRARPDLPPAGDPPTSPRDVGRGG